MTVGRLVRIGNSLGLIIPKKHLGAMSWWQGDVLRQEVRDGKLIIHNLTQKKLQPMHETAEYGDAISHKR